ncbi:hypothetical protein EV1_002432 [Malus domestica]
MHGYFAREDDLGGPRTVKDNRSIGSAYDRYLQNAEMASYTSGEASTFGGAGMGRAVGGGMTGPPMADHSMRGRPGAMSSDVLTNGRNMNLANQLPVDSMPRPGRETVPLPLDASSTLYVEGLPPDSTRREVAHIFRPFVGYKAVRLVSKESKHRGGDPLILCFVDFENPACAATALSALQGYEMDEHAPDSNYLRLQFSRFPGPRSGPGRNKRLGHTLTLQVQGATSGLDRRMDLVWYNSKSSLVFLLLCGPATQDYSPYLEMPSYTFGEASTFGGAGMGKAVGGEMTGPPMADHSMRGSPGAMSSDLLTYGRNMNLINQLPVDVMPRRGRETVPLPLDASSTLYVEGLPPDSTMREVAHIFRHFVGYKAVRLVNEESGLSIMQRGGDPLILCFVDFENPTYAVTALSALQGYEMDEQAPDSNYLRLQFYQFPDPRSRPGRNKG